MCGINGAFYLVAAIKQEFVSQFIGRGDLGAHNQCSLLIFGLWSGKKIQQTPVAQLWVAGGLWKSWSLLPWVGLWDRFNTVFVNYEGGKGFSRNFW